MSGCITVSDGRVDELIHFSEEIGARSPGWFKAQCERCDMYTTGTENVVEDWAYEHIYDQRAIAECLRIYSETNEKPAETLGNTTDFTRIIAKAIREFFGTPLKYADNSDQPVTNHLAEAIAEALDQARLITTIEQLHALPIPTPDHFAGVLIKCTALVDPGNGKYGLGDVYERNTDGTWCMLQDPSGADWGERRVASGDVPLPAVVLWIPAL